MKLEVERLKELSSSIQKLLNEEKHDEHSLLRDYELKKANWQKMLDVIQVELVKRENLSLGLPQTSAPADVPLSTVPLRSTTAMLVEREIVELTNKPRLLCQDNNNIKEKHQQLPLGSTVQIQASEMKSSAVDSSVMIFSNLMENITKSTDWQKAFTSKHGLEIIADNSTGKKMKFISKEKAINLELATEMISGQWKKENEQTAISMMIDLYLKSIEDKKINQHSVKGKNPEVISQAERKLAEQLKARGQDKVEINNKNIEDILNLKLEMEKTTEEAQDDLPPPRAGFKLCK